MGRKTKSSRQDFWRGTLVGLASVLLLASIFGAGYFTGQWRLKKTQFCFSPQKLPRPLRRIMEENLGTDFLRHWQGRVVLGTIKEIRLSRLVLQTRAGERRFQLTQKTRYFRGRRPISRAEITSGSRVALLLDQEKKSVRAVILLRSSE